jgi:hypothetical protein
MGGLGDGCGILADVLAVRTSVGQNTIELQAVRRELQLVAPFLGVVGQHGGHVGLFRHPQRAIVRSLMHGESEPRHDESDRVGGRRGIDLQGYQESPREYCRIT